jgi:hypothetical protein
MQNSASISCSSSTILDCYFISLCVGYIYLYIALDCSVLLTIHLLTLHVDWVLLLHL